MEEKRLNFNKPLLSVRRFHSSISSSAAGRTEKVEKNGSSVSVKKECLPFYRSDLKSGPVRNPGVVPFGWEQVPGLPKEDSTDSGDVTSADFNVADRNMEVPKFPSGSTSERLDDDCRRTVLKEEKEHSEKLTAVKVSGFDHRCQGSTAAAAAATVDDFDEEEDSFSDALETLSRTESCSMNCSVSGMTGIGDSTASAVNGPSGSFFSTDPQVRDFMMGRFLPAAQAMTTGSPKVNLRKPNSSTLEPPRRVQNGLSRRPVPLPYQNRPKTISRFPDSGQIESVDSEDDEDDDECYDDSRHMAMKGCGFLLPKFCFRSSLGLMNPVTGARVKSRPAALPRRQRCKPETKTSADQTRPVVYPREEQTWEAVFRHKLGDGVQKGEDGSKQTTESCPITYWSNSQSPNGSSSFRHSTGGGASPDRNDLSQPSFREGKGFLGFSVGDRKLGKVDPFESPRKGTDRNPLGSNKSWSGSTSPVIEKTLYVDSACIPETPNSISSSVNSTVFLSPKGKDCDVTAHEDDTVEETCVSQASEDERLQNENPEFLRTDKPCATDGSNHGENSGNNLCESREDAIGMDNSMNKLKLADEGKDSKVAFQSLLLPPPLPTSPSESWLRRTLPTVSSKNPNTQTTLLGKQFNSNKKTAHIPSINPFLKDIMQSSQMRFSEVLAKPLNEEC